MKRMVEPEILDGLTPSDPRAQSSRADLRRLNGLMKHAPILCAALKAKSSQPPRHIAEIGAGDGTLLLKIAEEMHKHWPHLHVTLVDQQSIVSDETLGRFQTLGWRAEVVVSDVFDWLARNESSSDAIFANLFLHHFADKELAEMLRMIATRTPLFLACETRREWPSFAVSHLLGLLGCNSVTRHDAVISMRAGFRGRELSALWPTRDRWNLEEHRAILFTHWFAARRTG